MLVNRSIGSKAPDSVIADLGKDAAAVMATHHLDIEKLEKAYGSRKAFEGYISDRERRLREFIKGTLSL